MRLPPLDLALLGAHYLLSASDVARAQAPHARPAGPPAEPPPWARGAPHAAFLARAACAGLPNAGLPNASGPGRADLREKPAARPASRAASRRRNAARTDAPSRPPAPAVPDPVTTNPTNTTKPTTPAPTTTPASPPSHAFVAPAWSDLPLRQRAEWALATADAGLRHIDTETALAQWERATHAMTLQWLHQPGDPRSCTAPSVRHLRADWRLVCQRHDATISLYWRTQRDPAMDERAARVYARLLIPHAKATLHSIDEEFLYQTNQLADRFDLARLLAGSRTPLALLQAVHAFLANDFPEHHASLMDEAALAIAARLRQRCMARSAGARRGATPMAAFREAIHAEMGAREVATTWLPFGDAATRFPSAWFDGVAIRNASGADVAALAADALAARRTFAMAPKGESIDAVQAEHWMRKRLRDLAESPRFPVGTPLQSIDTILLRLGPSHGIARASAHDVGTVLADFNRLCAAWRTAPRHWFAPTLSAAMHLARTGATSAAFAAPATTAATATATLETRLLDDFIRHLRVDVRQRQEHEDMPADADPRAIVDRVRETIEHADTARARRGAFGFDVDALIAWLDGHVAPTPALARTLPALPAGERARLSMLHGNLAMLGERYPRYLPLTAKLTLTPPRSPDTARVPLRHRALAARARAGDVVPLSLDHAPDAHLVYLRDAQRVVPLVAADATLWEVNWQGHVIGTLDARRLGKTHPALVADAPGASPSALVPRGAAALREGITVQQMQRWLDNHPAPPPSRAPVALCDVVDFGHDAQQRMIRDELDIAYARSATLRMLLQRASSRPDARRVSFAVGAGERARYVRAEHRIVVPPAAELDGVRVLGPTGATRVLPTAVWLHELMHAVTSLFDPPAPLSRAHRGPVVYLTSRVLYEMNRTSEERVAYATADAFDADGLPAHLARINARVLLENLLLDRQLARANAMTARTWVLGTDVAERVTVQAAIRLERTVRDARRRAQPQASFVQRLLDRFRWDALAAAPERGACLRAIDAFVLHARDIYERSAWGGAFLDAWLEGARDAPWTLHPLTTDTPAARDAAPCRVLAQERRVELALDDAFVYLSPTGCRPYTMRRRVAGLLARLAMPAGIADDVAHPETERGALAYVEDKLLGQGPLSEERRVAARLWPHAASTSANASAPVIHRDPTRARRAADDEDAYLALVCPPPTGCVPPP